MQETISSKTAKARKNHRCDWCMCEIAIGEKYNTSTFKYDGDIYHWKNHLKCEELVELLKMEGDEGVSHEDFYEYITHEFNNIYKGDNSLSFKEKVEFVYNTVTNEKQNLYSEYS